MRDDGDQAGRVLRRSKSKGTWRRSATYIGSCAMLLGLGALALWFGQQARSTDRAPMPADHALRSRLSKLPLLFVENHGQAASGVDYSLLGSNGAVSFSAAAIRFLLPGEPTAKHDGIIHAAYRREPSNGRRSIEQIFLGAQASPPQGLDPAATRASYIYGPREQWQTAIPTFHRLVYRDLWPGIDLEYASADGALKYSFTVHPGADPAQIRMAYAGADKVSISDAGDLLVSAGTSGLRDAAPVAFQQRDGESLTVAASFAIDAQDTTMPTVSFELAAYDATQPLIIDPTVFLYSGFVSSNIYIEEPFVYFDPGYGVALDAAGNAYVTSPALRPDGQFDTNDVMVAKVNASGSSLDYILQFGGTGYDRPTGIAVDSAGAAYVVGNTNSAHASFPVTVGPDLTFNGDTNTRDGNGTTADAFIAKINPSGTALEYLGYIGGASGDGASDVAIDESSGSPRAWVVGSTLSDNTSFPVIAWPDQVLTADGTDGFIARLNPSGAALEVSGYLGGPYGNLIGIAIQPNGRVYVAGNTFPYPELLGPDYPDNFGSIFPITVGPSFTPGASFVGRFDSSNFVFEYLGYVGGPGQVVLRDLAVGADGSAYVLGTTTSTEDILPVAVGPDLTFNGNPDPFDGDIDAVVAKINPSGTSFDYLGYVGGDAMEIPFGIAVDASGAAYVVGSTFSTEATFPVVDGPSLTFAAPHFEGYTEGFITKVAPDGSGFSYSGFIGGSGSAKACAVAVSASGDAYVVGAAFSFGVGVPFPQVIGPNPGLEAGVFISKIGDPAPPASPTPTATATSTPTSTPTSTLLPSSTATAPASSTPTTSPTATPSSTPTSESTSTSTPRNSETATTTVTPTETPTATPTYTAGGATTAACPITPRSDCHTAPQGSIVFKTQPNDARWRWFSWRWQRGTTAMHEFGDPVSGNTNYEICIFDDGVLKANYSLAPQGQCNGKPCWEKAGTRRREYKYRTANDQGIVKFVVREGVGSASIRVVGRRTKLQVPSFTNSVATTVQLVKDPSSGPECWEASFASPAKIKSATKFRDDIESGVIQ